jgi:thiamine biosynthesis lipoprotein
MNHPQPYSFIEGDWCSVNGVHRFCHEAMAATFETFIQHENARYAQQAARAAFGVLDSLEGELSRFIENSDISRINNLAANQPLRIGLDAFECLKLSEKIYSETNGAFDVTFGTEKIKNLAEGGGISLTKLNEADLTVELLDSPVQIDLGGIGKGYALDKMTEMLREWSIDVALLHGGYSSVLALNAPADTKGWPVTLSNPRNRKQTLAYLYLKGQAVSSSGLQKGRHIIDPRKARPVEGKLAAWACAADAATADALSTAFMVMTPDEIEQYCSHHPKASAMVILKHQGQEIQKGKILQFGSWDSLIR